MDIKIRNKFIEIKNSISDWFITRIFVTKGAANGFYPLVLGKKVNIEGYGYILVCKCV